MSTQFVLTDFVWRSYVVANKNIPRQQELQEWAYQRILQKPGILTTRRYHNNSSGIRVWHNYAAHTTIEILDGTQKMIEEEGTKTAQFHDSIIFMSMCATTLTLGIRTTRTSVAKMQQKSPRMHEISDQDIGHFLVWDSF